MTPVLVIAALLCAPWLWRKGKVMLGFVWLRYLVLKRWRAPHPLRSALVELGDLLAIRLIYGRWL